MEEGIETVGICGGITVYTDFMLANLISDLYVSVNPAILAAALRCLISR